MSEDEKNTLAEKIKSAILNSSEDFLLMKKRLGQDIVAQIDGKIVTLPPDYFLEKRKNKQTDSESSDPVSKKPL
ncbi:hypothetical protein J0A68_21600 [Algoriphagus sp. H41]|uniref:Uncharacterized protein n=1 Tax=Algoriphagus oliviformis TaxID=2811231 RepID=A0ABS3CBL4_9BACT|nr:hypothetical protein [Algoriphagus oliviformis]MBN7813565.1 hypothetical protein [Algoriphagus oliviformis]